MFASFFLGTRPLSPLPLLLPYSFHSICSLRRPTRTRARVGERCRALRRRRRRICVRSSHAIPGRTYERMNILFSFPTSLAKITTPTQPKCSTCATCIHLELVNTSDLGSGALAPASSYLLHICWHRRTPFHLKVEQLQFAKKIFLLNCDQSFTQAVLRSSIEHFAEVQVHPWSFSISSTFSVSSLTMGLPKWPSMSSLTFSAAGPSILMRKYIFQENSYI